MIDVIYETIHDPVYYQPDEEKTSLLADLYDEHADQGLTAEGEVTIGGETVEIDCMAERDHSWGIRNWRGPDAWRWNSCLFDEDTAMQFWQVTRGQESVVEGYLHLDGTTALVEDVEIETEFTGDGMSQNRMTFALTDVGGRELELSGIASTIAPIDFEYGDERATIRRSLTTFGSPLTRESVTSYWRV